MKANEKKIKISLKMNEKMPENKIKSWYQVFLSFIKWSTDRMNKQTNEKLEYNRHNQFSVKKKKTKTF